MGKRTFLLTGIAGFLVLLALSFSFPSGARASSVNVHIGIGFPIAPVGVAAPPVVLIPQTPVYYAPYYGTPLFFYAGYWYRPFDGYWYRGASYSGPWRYVNHRHIPERILKLPAHYYQKHKNRRAILPDYPKKHWDRREKVRYRK
jgi:hypothetical protein